MLLSSRLVRLAEAQNWRCAYCGERCDGDDPFHPKRPTIDEVIPRRSRWDIRYKSMFRSGFKVRGWENQVMACMDCNNKKGHRDAMPFYNEVLKRQRLASIFPTS